MQELYNKLRLKRVCGRGDVVLRLSYEEMEVIFEAMEDAGADKEKGTEHIVLIQEIMRQQSEDIFDEKKANLAYDGMRVKVQTGKYKEAVGIVHVTKDEKKPFHVVFPSGDKQNYTAEQFDVIAKDRQKYEEKLNAIIFAKGEKA